MSNVKTLMNVHGACADLHFAVSKELAGLGAGIEIVWRPGTYLSVEIEVPNRNAQIVMDKLAHGVLNGNYDYRFPSRSRHIRADPNDIVTISVYPDLQRIIP